MVDPNGGRSWSEILSAGGRGGIQLAFSDPNDGFMSIRDSRRPGDAYVLRTIQWRQHLAPAGDHRSARSPTTGSWPAARLDAAALLHGVSVTNAAASTVCSSPPPPVATSPGPRDALSHDRQDDLHQAQARAAHYSVRVTARSPGRSGARAIVVSRRNLAGGPGSSSRSSRAPTAAASRPPGTSASPPCSWLSGPATAAVRARAQRFSR